MTETDSALPAESAGTEITRFNALKHGILSRYTVLPWEDEDEYRVLIDALVVEHAPSGPTEEHLVEELAGILWRKRRLRLAEGAVYRRGLKDALRPHSETTEAALVHLDAGEQTERTIEAVRATPEETRQDVKELGEDRAMTEKALKLLRAGKPGAYEKAIEALQPDTRRAWEEQLEEWEPDDYEEGQEPYTADAASLQRYLETVICPWYETRRKGLENRPLIHSQAFGEALDPDRMQGLARYEVHLDRKLERTLTMLIRLQDLRRGSSET
jgi:hypothetical protein